MKNGAVENRPVQSNTTYLLQLGFHYDVKMLYQAIQIWNQQRFGTVFCEVDESSSCMRLHSRVALVLHRFKQSGNHLRGGYIFPSVILINELLPPLKKNVLTSVSTSG